MPPGDTAAHTDTLRWLFTDRRLATRLAGHGRRRAAGYHRVVLADRVLTAYESLVSAPAGIS